MFGMVPTINDPVASYDVVGDRLYKNQHPGTRGYGSRSDTLTTNLGSANDDLVFTSRAPRPQVGAIQVQYGIVGPNAPLTLYEGGTPATLKLATSQGYQLAATFPGIRGNLMSLTLVDPGGLTSDLSVRAIPPGQIIVTLARASSAITTTAAQLVAALNAATGVKRWVTAWVSADSPPVTPLTALPLTYFQGGLTVPFLVYVGLVSNVAGLVSTTAAQVAALMAGTSLVTAANAPSNSGVGAVSAMGPLALTGGALSAGALLNDDTSELEVDRLKKKLGSGEGHLNNYGLQMAASRQAAIRSWQVVPTQTRAITASSDVNYAKEHKPRSLFL